jgi:transposase-like protein
MKKDQAITLKSPAPIRGERRYFSEEARRTIVKEIEDGLSKAEASRKYEVSLPAIHKWIQKYSVHYQACLVKVVEHLSESNKVKKLEAELERAYAMLGRTKASMIFLEMIIEKANEGLGVDLKKNFDPTPSSRSMNEKPISK